MVVLSGARAGRSYALILHLSIMSCKCFLSQARKPRVLVARATGAGRGARPDNLACAGESAVGRLATRATNSLGQSCPEPGSFDRPEGGRRAYTRGTAPVPRGMTRPRSRCGSAWQFRASNSGRRWSLLRSNYSQPLPPIGRGSSRNLGSQCVGEVHAFWASSTNFSPRPDTSHAGPSISKITSCWPARCTKHSAPRPWQSFCTKARR